MIWTRFLLSRAFREVVLLILSSEKDCRTAARWRSRHQNAAVQATV